MPGLVKKLVVVAAGEGLILQSLGHRNQRPVQIKYATHEISSLGYAASTSSFISAEALGIVGIRDTQFRDANASLISWPKDCST